MYAPYVILTQVNYSALTHIFYFFFLFKLYYLIIYYCKQKYNNNKIKKTQNYHIRFPLHFHSINNIVIIG